MIEHLINQTKVIMYAVAELQRCDEYGWDSDAGEQKNYGEHLQLERAQRELDGAIVYLQEAQRMKSSRE